MIKMNRFQKEFFLHASLSTFLDKDYKFFVWRYSDSLPLELQECLVSLWKEQFNQYLVILTCTKQLLLVTFHSTIAGIESVTGRTDRRTEGRTDVKVEIVM